MILERAPVSPRTRRNAYLTALGAATALLASCIEPLPPFADGTLRLAVVTTGGDVDLDGYGVKLNGVPLSDVNVNQTLLFERVAAGTHTLELTGLSVNCAVSGDNPRSVTIGDGSTVDTSFDVACVVTGIWVVITTTGVELPTSYLVAVDGGAGVSAPRNSSALLSRLAPGAHSTLLTGLADNCAVVGSNPVNVVLSSGQTVVVPFDVACGHRTASIAVSAATSGSSLPASDYGVRLNGDQVHSLPINGAIVIGGVGPGSHILELTNLPTNCNVAGANPKTASVTIGGLVRDTADVAFSVSCAGAGSIAVTATTSGADLPRRAYEVVIDGSPADSLPIGGSRVFDGLVSGDHSVELTRLPFNCGVVGANPVTATVTTGDSTAVAFDVVCVATPWGLAFTRAAPSNGGLANAIHVARADGSNVTFFAWGSEAAWSPDGAKLAFAACVWRTIDDYYYGTWSACFPSGLAVSDAAGGAVTAITINGSDTDPAWSPDGARLAFHRAGRLYVVHEDGSGEAIVPLPTAVRSAMQPSWSPDGTTLAFTCEVETANLDVCTVRPNGASFTRLTAAPHREAAPAWKPDASVIAYTDSPVGGASRTALITPDGTSRTTIPTAVGALRPSWAADGAALAFVGVECNVYSGCRTVGLFRVNADGSGLTQLTSESDDSPALRP